MQYVDIISIARWHVQGKLTSCELRQILGRHKIVDCVTGLELICEHGLEDKFLVQLDEDEEVVSNCAQLAFVICTVLGEVRPQLQWCKDTWSYIKLVYDLQPMSCALNWGLFLIEDSLFVGECFEAVWPVFFPISWFLDPAKWETRLGSSWLVDKHHSSF